MGIFDTYDPDSYAPGATQRGLLDRLLLTVGATPANSGPGFSTPPMDANAAMSPAPTLQASPIAVGDYQMPRVGSEASFTLPAGQLDPATGEHVAQPASPVPAPVQPPASSPDLGSHLMAGYQNLRHGGGLIGSIVAAASGKRNDPITQAQQQQYAALVSAGLSPQEATVALLNPEAGKALLAQKFGPQTLTPLGQGYVADRNGKVTRAYTPEQSDNFTTVQTGEDGFGRKTFSKMNKATGAVTPIASGPGADAPSVGLGDTSKTGAEYLTTLPPDLAGRVKAMVEGRQPPPSTLAQTRPYWQNLLAAAQQYDPTFDATNWSGRVAGVKDFSAGKSAEMVRSANQTLHHVGQLLTSMDDLRNGDYPLWNRIGNAASEARGSGAQGAFRTNAHAVAEELSKVFKGSNLSDAEIHAWEANLHENMSPEQQRTQIAKLRDLLAGSLHALEEKRLASIGPMAAEKAGPLIRDEGQHVLKRIDDWIKGGSKPAALPAGWSVQVR